MTGRYRPGLPPDMPAAIARLPVHRGYPVPWFVASVSGEPDFRIVDPEKIQRAVLDRRCWICGRQLLEPPAFFAFVIGPMCAVNRISSEPPSHVACADWSARACPFLTRPHMERREGGLPEALAAPAGTMIRRNPGVALVWLTRKYELVRDHQGGVLFRVGDPVAVRRFAEGREATIDELQHSIETGLPALREIAERQGPDALLALDQETRAAARLLGIRISAGAS